MDTKEKVVQLTDEMITALARLVQYNSELAEAKPGRPFGDGPYLALEEALSIAEGMGFKTKNVDGYCGYAEMGEGEDILGIVAHLDIVPAGDGWDTDPFQVIQKDGVLYGRGVSDDKGGAICSLYAMKLIREAGIPLNKRVRLLLGCNEETGSKCMEHYNQVEEPITLGFTPDGSFPGIYGEKGHMHMEVTSKNTKILAMNGGFVSNAVCHRCETVIPVGEVDIDALKAALAATPLNDFTLTEEDGKLTILAIGASAHASTPDLGVNAAGYTMKALADAGFKDDFVEYYNSHIGHKGTGEGFNIGIEDEYGALTLCNGIVKTVDGVINCTIDIRVPVTFHEPQVRELIADRLEDAQGKCEIKSIGEPLFFPVDSPMVKALVDAYVKITGDTETKPMVIGGGTYAKSIPGIIAFGCEFPGTITHIHEPNECLEINQMQKQVEIYVEAIQNLLAL